MAITHAPIVETGVSRQPGAVLRSFQGARLHLLILWRRWRRAARDRAMLAAMDPRTRRDVGITLADVQFAYRRPWWQWPIDRGGR